MQGGVERSLLDTQYVAGNLLDTFRDGPAVLRLKDQRLQDEQIQSALRKIDTCGGHVGWLVPFRFYRKDTRFPVEAQGDEKYFPSFTERSSRILI